MLTSDQRGVSLFKPVAYNQLIIDLSTIEYTKKLRRRPARAQDVGMPPATELPLASFTTFRIIRDGPPIDLSTTYNPDLLRSNGCGGSSKSMNVSSMAVDERTHVEGAKGDASPFRYRRSSSSPSCIQHALARGLDHHLPPCPCPVIREQLTPESG